MKCHKIALNQAVFYIIAAPVKITQEKRTLTTKNITHSICVFMEDIRPNKRYQATIKDTLQ